MKLKTILAIGLVALLTTACQKDEGIDYNPAEGLSYPILIDNSIDQQYVSRVDDGGFCEGDEVGLYGVNYTNDNTAAGTLLDEGNQVDNARYTYDEANNKWIATGNIYYKDAETNIDLYAYYPYGNPTSTSAYAFEVQQDQSGGNTVDGYGLSDFLWTKAENITPSEAKVKLRFSHRLACAHVVLVEGEGFAAGEFDALEKSILVMNTTRTATIDLATGVATATGEAPSEGIVMKQNAEGFRAIVVPQTVAALKPLFAITVDGIGYRFKRETAFTYEAGKQSKFTIEVKKKAHSGQYEFTLVDSEIVDWVADLDTHGGEARQYYVVHQEEPGTLRAKLREAKKDPNKIKNLKISGKIDVFDFMYMRDSMEVLQSLNIKEVIITSKEYTYEDLYNYGITLYNNPTGVIKYSDTQHIGDFVSDCEVLYGEDLSLIGRFYPYADNEIPCEALSGKSSLINLSLPENITKIKYAAFANCSLLSGAFIIPDSVEEIGSSAFRGCNNLSSISLPQKLKKIGGSAFDECASWSGNLNIPSTVFYIGDGAFGHCRSLTGSLQLPNGLTYLGNGAFQYCKSFTGNLTIPQGVTTLGERVFTGCTGLNGQLILHDNIQTIGAAAFHDCRFQGELKLPNNLQEIPSNCFAYNEFSSIAEFPQTIFSIGFNAFYNCWRLLGILKLPDSLVSLGDFAFYGCSSLGGVVLPAELSTIRVAAFENCYNLNNIICEAIEPPYVQERAFNGVAKDNFVVEVPEQSVNRYQNDTNWGEFKRIVAHQDFSISHRLMRVLNAKHSRELVLRTPANYAWSIESKPDWVTVTPSSGVGKTEVVVTVNEMTSADISTFEINTGTYNSPNYETHNGRAGEIVFLLNDKNYRTTLKVEQYDCDNYDGEVIPNQPASVGNGVNIVFMGDCFDARDIAMGNYLDGINEAIGYYFDIEPYKTYKPYFNIYTVVGMSNDSGMGTVNTIRDAKFGSQYSLNGISPNHETCYEYAMKASTVNEDNLGQTLVVMIENTTEYGGICYMWGDGSAIACCPMSADAYPYDFRGIVQHEAGGHGFGKLADEYIYHNAFIQNCSCLCCSHLKDFNAGKSLGWYRNLESVGDMEKVGWSHLVFNPKYSNIVDVYEGGFFHSRGIFRSEPNSCMNNNIPYYSTISRQEMVERIKRYAGEEFDINEFYANDVLDSQGNITGGSRSVVENAITLTGAGKQMPPKFMGDKPQLR